MSAAELSAVLRNHIVEKYATEQIKFGSLGKGTRKDFAGNLVQNRFRDNFTSADAEHGALVTKDGLDALAKGIKTTISGEVTNKLADQIFNSINFGEFLDYIKNWIDSTSSVKASIRYFSPTDHGTSVDDPTIIGASISNIPQARQKSLFVEYISEKINSSSATSQVKKKLIATISDGINAGHLAGIFSTKTLQAFAGNVKFNSVDNATYRDFTVNVSDSKIATQFDKDLTVILKSLIDADFLSSNIVDKQQLMLVSTKKALSSNPRFETELQFSIKNQDSGRNLVAAGGALNKMINQIASGSTNDNDLRIYYKSFLVALKKIQVEIEKEAKNLLTNPANKELAKAILIDNATLKALINTPGSTPIVKGIGICVAAAIAGKPIPKEEITRVTLNKQIVSESISANNINKTIKNIILSVKKTKSETKNKEQNSITLPPVKLAKNIANQPISLASLQALINSALGERIADNMGTGMREDILNFQSGRFASTVEVERMSASREGMITAFYRYMKYPYATFEPGGRQGLPKSRDPKLLISKSIREIASSIVGNRMRAVSL